MTTKAFNILLTIFFHVNHLSVGQTKLLESKITECIKNCSYKSELISLNIANNLMYLKVAVHLNCIVKSTSPISYLYKEDTLNIIVQETQVRHDTIVSIIDSIQTIEIIETRESAMCKSFFFIELVLTETTKRPKTILINGLTFTENYNRRTMHKKED